MTLPNADPPRRLVLLGHPVGHSLSPHFQNAALAAARIDLTYQLVDVPPSALPSVLHAIVRSSTAGNVTIPHKEAVCEACDRVTEVARKVRAVNTFWTEQGALVGDNTDVEGFEAAVDVCACPRAGARVALLGAGGAAAAVCAAVSTWPGATVIVTSRSSDRARALADRFSPWTRVTHTPTLAARDATLVVNATPLGLHGSDEPMPVRELPRDACVMDLVYRAGLTPWIRNAKAAGFIAIDGREMLLAQGAAAFRRWFNQQPDLSAMRTALERALE